MSTEHSEQVLRVLLVDDETLVRESFTAFFRRQPAFELVGTASDGPSGIEAYERLRPDVVLMDLHMPAMNGLETTTQIMRRWPDACIVALTTFGGREYVVPMLRAGAAGYLVKHTAAAELLPALRAAIAGDMPMSPEVRRELTDVVTHDAAARRSPAVDVSPREREMLQWLAHGLSNNEIAQRMHFSEGSVKQYMAHIGQKLDARSRTQILVRSIQEGIVDPRKLPPLD